MINGLPERLRSLREKYGFSQREIAKRLNISPSVVSGYENGEKTPSLEVLIAISDIYCCSTDYLLGKKPTDIRTTIDVSELSSKQIQAIARVVESMKE